jgi:hypothetical protein
MAGGLISRMIGSTVAPNCTTCALPTLVARRLGHDPVTLLRAYARPLETDRQIVREALKAMLPAGDGGK